MQVYLNHYYAQINNIHLVKAFIRRNWWEFHNNDDPVGALLEASQHIQGDIVKGWFIHSGYDLESDANYEVDNWSLNYTHITPSFTNDTLLKDRQDTSIYAIYTVEV